MTFLQYLDLPPLPNKIIKEILLDSDNPQEKNKVVHYDSDGSFGKQYAGYRAYFATDIIQQWCDHNFPGNRRAVVTKLIGGGEMIPHVDIDRQLALNCLITSGGALVLTRFFKLNNFNNVLHTRFVKTRDIFDSGLTVLEEYCIPKHTWHILRTDCIHDVSYIDSDRVLLSIDLSESNFDRLIDQYTISVEIIRNTKKEFLSSNGTIIQ